MIKIRVEVNEINYQNKMNPWSQPNLECMWWAQALVYSYGGQRTTLGIVPQELSTLIFGEKKSLTGIWGSLNRLDLLARDPQGWLCLYLPGFVISSTHHHSQLFTSELEICASCLRGSQTLSSASLTELSPQSKFGFWKIELTNL